MTVTAQHRRAVLKRTLSRGLQYLVLVIFTLIVLVPIVILVFGALKTRGEMYSLPYTIPNPPHWENFGKILSQSSFWTMLRNSLLVMVSTTLSVLAICSLAAFVFARLNFKGKNLLFNFLTLGLMFPITVAIMPVFLVIREMQLTNTHLNAFYAELGITMGTENPERTPGSGQGGGNGGDPAARQATQAAAEALGTPVGTGSSSGQDRKNALTEAVIEALLAIVNN